MSYKTTASAFLSVLALAAFYYSKGYAQEYPTGADIAWKSGHTLQTMSSEQIIRIQSTAGMSQHIVIQFGSIPTAAEQQSLEIQGITLLRYLGSRAYFARLSGAASICTTVPEGGVSASVPGMVYTILGVEPEVKLHPDLLAGSYPSYCHFSVTPTGEMLPPPYGDAAAQGNDPSTESKEYIAVYAIFHPDVDLETTGVTAIEQECGSIRDYIYSINGVVAWIPVSNLYTFASQDEVEWVEPALPPLGENNDSNRQITQVNQVQAAPYGLDGTGIGVLVYDGGYAYSSHVDFGGRLTVHDSSGQSTHATHVSGTVGGSGSASSGTYKGMAPGVKIESYGFQYDGSGTFLYTNPGDLEADYNAAINLYGAVISNDSIGTNLASNGFPCEYEGDYGATCMLIDAIVCGSLGKPMRIVWSNGNERGNGRCGTTYHTTAPPACAKNHITVGALNSNDDSMTSFSSWGPSDDGRLKPDICGPGCQTGGDGGVTSCSSSSTGYTVYCGTSMSGPTVTGIGALILQDWKIQFPDKGLPRNSTLKMLLGHNAADLGNPGPDYQYGYGSVRVKDTIDFMRRKSFLEEGIGNGEQVTVLVPVSAGTAALKATLAWDDPPGAINTIPELVNDLDVVAISPMGTVHYPWTLDPANPSIPAVRTKADHVNNIEQVLVQSPEAGVWTIKVTGYSVPKGPQTFSLGVSPDLALCSSAGTVLLDQSAYHCEGTATITVVDCDLNLNPSAIDTAMVSVASDSDLSGMTVQLTETGAASANFVGTIPFSTTGGGGTLRVSHNDTVYAVYHDDDNGSGYPSDAYAEARLDCQPSGVSLVFVKDIGKDTATVIVESTEDTTVEIRVGNSPEGPFEVYGKDTTLSLHHEVPLKGLPAGSNLFFVVDVYDAAGNLFTDTNGGSGYGLTTLPNYRVPLTDDFEAGTLDHWTLHGGSIGDSPLAQIDSTPVGLSPHSGKNVVFLGKGTSGSVTETTMDLVMDLSNVTDAKLNFWWATYSLESSEYIQLDIWDGSWHTNVNNWAYRSTTWQERTLDLSGFSLIDGFIIRFHSRMDSSESSDASYVDDVRVTGTIRDALSVNPVDKVILNGPTGGPFIPNGKIYAITNTESTPFDWVATSSVPWLTITPRNGTLAPGEVLGVNVSLDASTSAFPQGIHTGSIDFVNVSTGVSRLREMELWVNMTARMPFYEDFEAGAMEGFWKVTGTNQYRTQRLTSNGPKQGSYHLIMDDSVNDSVYSRNEVTLTIDLENYRDVLLTFWCKEFAEEDHGPPPIPFVNGYDFDGVAISQDGINWYEVHPLRSLSSTYTQYTVSLDAAISTYHLSYNSNFKIRFNQYDDDPITSDGIAIDDIRITGRFDADLTVLPGTGLIATGYEDGPFTPASQTYSLTNISGYALDWTAYGRESWIQALPSSGTLNPGDSVLVDVSLTGETAMMAPGIHWGSVLFTDANKYLSQWRPVKLEVISKQAPLAKNLEELVCDGIATPLTLIAFDDGYPNPPAGLEYTIVTLPSHGSLRDALGGEITAVPYTLASGGNQVVYTSTAGATVTDSFQFRANDGGTPPKGGDSNTAMYSLTVKQVPPSSQSALPLDGSTQVSLDPTLRWIDPGVIMTVPYAVANAGLNEYTEPAGDLEAVRVTSYPAVSLSASGLIVNGDFETGDFSGWTTRDSGSGGFAMQDGSYDPEGPDGPLPPFEGSYSVQSHQSGLGTHTLLQVVTLPPELKTATLYWSDMIRNHAGSFLDPDQEFRVEIWDMSDHVIRLLYSTGSGDTLINGWTQRSADLTSYAGQTIQIAFTEQDSVGHLNVHLDAIQIDTTGKCLTKFDVYIGENSPPSQLIRQDLGAPQCTIPFPLKCSTTYYWRVVSHNCCGAVEGPVWSFTTRGIGDIQPTIPYPAHDTVEIPINPTLAWWIGGTTVTAAAEEVYGDYDYASPSNGVATVEHAPSVEAYLSGLVNNGNFETGDFSGWTLQNSGDGSFIMNDGSVNPEGPDGPLPAYEGSFSSLCEQRGAGTRTLWQEIVLPVNATTAVLRWADMIRNHAGSYASGLQEYRVEIRDTSDTTLTKLFSTKSGDSLLTGWTERAGSLSSYAGQTIRIAFVVDDRLGYFNVHVDGVRIELSDGGSSCPTSYDVYLNKTTPPGTPVRENLSVPYCTLPNPLEYEHTYFWQVMAKNCCGIVSSEIWAFHTAGAGNIEITDTTPPYDDLDVPFHDIIVGCSRTEQISISNTEPKDNLILGKITLLNDVTNFRIRNVPVLPITIPAGGHITLEAVYAPTATGAHNGRIQIESNDIDEPVASVSLHGIGVNDPLQIVPTGEFISIGPLHGPFSPSEMDYTLSNTGVNSIPWTATVNVSWLSLSKNQGSIGLTPETIKVSINSTANSLPEGIYTGQISFTDAMSGIVQKRIVRLLIGTTASMPFTETFETGTSLKPCWKVTGTNSYRTQVSSSYSPHGGSYHLLMDSLSGYSRNEVTLTVNLANYTDVQLKFWAVEFSEESHGPPPIPFVGGYNFDGVAISTDGNVWYEVAGLRSLSSSYSMLTVNLDSELAKYGLKYGPMFQIRFNQYDNSALTSDGIGIDDISITGKVKDNLGISPESGRSFIGYDGGPFKPANQNFTLTNSGITTLNWSVTSSASWLDVSPTDGMLAGGISTDVLTSLNANAASLSPGNYVASLNFTNQSSGVSQTRTVTLQVIPCTIPPAPSNPGPISGSTNVPRNPTLSWSLSGSGTVNILAFTGYADMSSSGEYNNTINAIKQYYSNITVTTTTSQDPAVLSSLLADKKVFLFPEQESWSSSGYGSFGTAIQSVLQNFVQNGGIVIVCDHYPQGASSLFLKNAGMMDAPYYSSTTSSKPSNVVVSHPITKGVTTFSALNGNVSYSAVNDGTALAVETSTNKPIVAYKSIGSGSVVLIGWDFYSYNLDMARLIANAVEMGAAPLFAGTYDVYLDTVNPPVTRVAQNISDPTFKPALLIANTPYYWKTVAKTPCGQTQGAVWSFTTGSGVLGLMLGDTEPDGDVDLVDLDRLMAQWLRSDCFDSTDENAWCSGTDLNQDGVVDMADFGLMAQNWLENLP